MLKNIALICASLSVASTAPAREANLEPAECGPVYTHIFVIVEENKDFSQVMDPAIAPNISRLANEYASADNFFGEEHPSEANYLALLGGDTFGIHDDDAFYCTPGSTAAHCNHAREPGYVDHTVNAAHLGDQLRGKGLSWKGYYESLPEPGSLAVLSGDSRVGRGSGLSALYASKHSGFANFRDVQIDPARSSLLVGFEQLDADIAVGKLPAFALIVPNQCNEMHGLFGIGVPGDCTILNTRRLITRGDRVVGELVAKLQATADWRSHENMAIVITFDEGSGGSKGGCCSVTPGASSNYGGGHIPTIVITNHGPRGLRDATPYNHYSLLRTIEDAFRITEHLRRAGDSAGGVVSMTPLFQAR
ncbi:alkaline phosphatase family protein [Sphingomonas sp. PL20]|uniref:alkaline phosphatase family protein n=1 Tax=Sphingomonas sp. PL20 TaxID=2760712 RepID=UPI001AE7C8BC